MKNEKNQVSDFLKVLPEMNFRRFGAVTLSDLDDIRSAKFLRLSRSLFRQVRTLLELSRKSPGDF